MKVYWYVTDTIIWWLEIDIEVSKGSSIYANCYYDGTLSSRSFELLTLAVF